MLCFAFCKRIKPVGCFMNFVLSSFLLLAGYLDNNHFGLSLCFDTLMRPCAAVDQLSAFSLLLMMRCLCAATDNQLDSLQFACACE